SIAEATVIRWLKEEGETIEADESVLEIATDKVDSEVPSPKGGVLKKKLYGENDVVKVGDPVAIIELEGSESAEAPAAPAVAENAAPAVVAEKMVSQAQETVAAPAALSGGSRFYSPLVLNIARTEGISMTELEGIAGSGNEGRVTKKDILAYVNNRANGTAPAPTAPVNTPSPAATPAATVKTEIKAPAVSMNAGDEIIEMDRMRKIIADHMVMSKHVSPHVTSFVEADVTNLVLWRDKVKDSFQKREGEKITFTPIFIEAVTKAIKDFPMINISVDGDKIIKRKDINIGMATALPTGNLIVPVIKNADQKNLLGLTKDVNNLANKARANKLSPDDIQGGTYTLTNVGGFGNVMGTPIINQPQVAILAVGAIKKKPAVIETPQGDLIGIRHFMYLSHSYDHRVVDGALGGMFVRRVADYLEQWDINREI
ncbi:MAG: 2-oxo acid dehydrogenase subunit E2, partial [Bacteroidota bacterium]|nr:2-oxo acid dehydrogenase subunit E2 [Bacteroidota bacterium]MDX5429718.1 2-oxo acid dehydrogenase subunit E2 [Bacteroidota bacterium]MDX5468499.1 2-oxo acid dehydrogenase subunit E2 [Bacteroidota bacterium]